MFERYRIKLRGTVSKIERHRIKNWEAPYQKLRGTLSKIERYRIKNWEVPYQKLRGAVSNPSKCHSHIFSTRGSYLRGPVFILWYTIYFLTAVGLSPGGSSTHLHTNNTQNDTKQTIHRTTQQLESAGRARSWLVIPWHLPYDRGKSTEKPQSG
jgi:hypothetical protein